MNEWENDNRIRKRNWVSIDVRSLKSVSVFNINPFRFYYPLMHLWCVIFFCYYFCCCCSSIHLFMLPHRRRHHRCLVPMLLLLLILDVLCAWHGKKKLFQPNDKSSHHKQQRSDREQEQKWNGWPRERKITTENQHKRANTK